MKRNIHIKSYLKQITTNGIKPLEFDLAFSLPLGTFNRFKTKPKTMKPEEITLVKMVATMPFLFTTALNNFSKEAVLESLAQGLKQAAKDMKQKRR